MHLNIQLWLHHYGYTGIFMILFLEVVGIPFPAETSLTISGIEWTQHVFSLVPLLVAAALGNIVGSTVAYGIGRYLGRPIIVRFGRFVGITEARLAVAEERFARYRSTIVLFGKFIAGIRVLIPYLAGMNSMPFFLFSLYNAASAFAWAAFFIVLGKYIGMEWTKYHALFHRYLVPSIILAVLLVAGYVYLKIRAKKKERREEEAYLEKSQ